MALAVACGPADFLGAGGAGGAAGLLSVLTCGSVHRPDAHLWLSTINSARNSSTTHSNIEFASLELQRFWGILKTDRDKLRAKFGWRWCRCRPLRPSTPRASIGASARCPAPPPTRTAARGPRGQALRSLQRPSCRWRWGFCSIRGWLSACRRRVVVLMTPFPPFGGGDVAV